ncbi:MAG TPA: DNA polymerase III subunit alpha [Chloroflexota bacterium]|nr:DNA polymerase III subunit alpha [Chloroflexota bacterium]
MIHLHVHSNFSFLDGASPPDRLLQRAAELGMPALALTDHHGLYGAVRFIHAARALNVKPIVGVEICILEDDASAHSPPTGSRGLSALSRSSRKQGWGERRPHLVLLARNRQGYGNLCRIITQAQLDYQDDPRIALADITPHAAGLIALSGCRRGEIASHLLAGRHEEAVTAVGRYAEIFGDDFWIELEHHLLPDDTALVEALLDLARRTGRRCLIANDVHYAYPHEYRLRDVMACIQTRTTLDEWSDVRHANGEYYLKSHDEMRAAFGLPRKVFDSLEDATEEVADGCDLQLLAVSCRPPDFPVPEKETAFSYLYQLCQEGARARYQPLTPAVSKQLAHELSVIEQMGLASFFLCVWDIVRFARENGIRCAGRGSAADSVVAYVLGITAVDPIANNLLFERFLNPGRVGMPDVDIDFDSRRRDEVIEYIQNRYTTEHAAMVANVITYRSRSAFRDVAKAMGFPSSLVDYLASKLSYRGVGHMREELLIAGELPPPVSSSEGSGSEREAQAPAGVVPSRFPLSSEAGGIELGKDQVPLATALALCEQLDGYPRHLSLHNGGMLITAEPLIDVVPVEYATSGVRVCQFNKDDVELLGLIKFDILGLRTLSIVDEAVRAIRDNRGLELPIDDLALDDPAVFDLICSSKTIGIFQVESPGQWALLARAQPRTFADLIIQISLFRPGPLQGGMVNPYVERKQGREPITYPHPSLEECLRDTLGIVIFQEQVLQVAHDFAGLSYADADGLRRAISHYRTEVQMDVCRQAFVESAVQLGRGRELAERIYEMIAYFSGYGFCRSHAAAFAKIVYQTAFLKVYYPAEFLAGILSNEPCCYYPTQTVIEEARKWGIRVLPVDVNRSRARYGADRDTIRMGLMQVKGLTEDTAEEIVHARGRRPFASLADFWSRTETDRDAVENLISVGAFDSLGVNRRKLLWSIEEVARTVPRHAAPRPLFRRSALATPPPVLPAMTELDVAGLDFTLQDASARYSIMSFYRRSLRRARVLSIGQLEGRAAGTLVRTAGIVISRQQPPTAKGMTFLVLADEEGELPVAVYPQVYRQHRQIVNGSSALVLEGTIQRQRYTVSLLARRIWRLNDVAEMDTKPYVSRRLPAG